MVEVPGLSAKLVLDISQFASELKKAQNQAAQGSLRISKSVSQGAQTNIRKLAKDAKETGQAFVVISDGIEVASDKISVASKVLEASLGSAKVASEGLITAGRLILAGFLPVSITLIKLFPLFEKLRGNVQRAGLQLDKFTIGLNLLVASGLQRVAGLLATMGPRFIGVQRSIASTTGVVAKLTNSFSKAAFSVSSFLIAFGPVNGAVKEARRSFGTATTGVGLFLARSKEASKGLGGFSKVLRSVGASLIPVINRVFQLRTVLPALGLVAGVIVVGALVKLIKFLSRVNQKLTELSLEAIKSSDSIGKMASRLGLTAEALQEFQFIASQSGVETNVLNTAVQRFLRRLGEARKGTGVLVKDLKELGIQLDDSNGFARDGVEVFKDYLAIIGATADSTEKLRLATVGFDTEGAALVNIANRGRDSIEKLAEQARDLGIVLSEETIRKAAELNDQLDILARQRLVASQEAFVAYGDVVVFFAEVQTQFSKSLEFVVDQFRTLENLSFNKLQRRLESTENFLQRIRQQSEGGTFAPFAFLLETEAVRVRDRLIAAIAEVRPEVDELLAGVTKSVQAIKIDLSVRGLEDVRELPDIFADIGRAGRQAKQDLDESIRAPLEDEFQEQIRNINERFNALLLELNRATDQELAKQNEQLVNLRQNLEANVALLNNQNVIGARRTPVLEQINRIEEVILETERNILGLTQAQVAAVESLRRARENALAVVEREQTITALAPQDQVLLRSIRSLLTLANATSAARSEFARLEKQFRRGEGITERSRKKFEETGKALEELKRRLQEAAGLLNSEERAFSNVRKERGGSSERLKQLC